MGRPAACLGGGQVGQVRSSRKRREKTQVLQCTPGLKNTQILFKNAQRSLKAMPSPRVCPSSSCPPKEPVLCISDGGMGLPSARLLTRHFLGPFLPLRGLEGGLISAHRRLARFKAAGYLRPGPITAGAARLAPPARRRSARRPGSCGEAATPSLGA